MVAGMIAVTGCSSNVPDTNQGNRNGQRVVDAVNRRTDSYGFTRARNNGDRATRGFNRGLRRTTGTDRTVRTRHYNNVAHPGLGLDGAGHYRHNTGTQRSTPSHNTNTFNRGRVGHTFGYNQYGNVSGIDGEYGGYDLGQRAGTRVNNPNNAANLNNRVVRSTPARNTINNTAAKAVQPTRNTGSTKTVKPTRSTGSTRAVKPTRSTASTKAVKPTRSAAHTKTVQPTRNTRPARSTHTNRHNTAARPSTTARPNTTTVRPNVATRGNAVHPMLHNTNNYGAVSRAVPTRSATNRQTNLKSTTNGLNSRRLSPRSEMTRSLRQNAHAMHSQNTNIAPGTPVMNATNRLPRANRGFNRASFHNNQNRSSRRAASRRAGSINNMHHTNYAHRGFNERTHFGYDFNAASNDFNTDFSNAVTNNNNNIVHGMYARDGYNRTRPGLVHSVPVSLTDGVDDYAFFKRNKTNNDEAPATPEPQNVPQVPGRSNRVSPSSSQPVPAPIPAASPAPTGLDHDQNDTAYNNIHYPHNAPGSVNINRAGHRVMK